MYKDTAVSNKHAERKTGKQSSHRQKGSVHTTTTQPAAVEPAPSSSYSSNSIPQSRQRSKAAPKTAKPATNTCKYQCKLCNANHYVFFCSQFLDKTVPQRKEHLSSNSLCQYCLKPGHSVSDCRSDYRCRLCKGNHNSLIHQDAPSSNPQAASGSVHVAKSSALTPPDEEKLMMTGKVLLTGPSGKKQEVRALLDSGADTCIINNQIMKSLKLKKLDTYVTLTGIASSDNPPSCPTAQVIISSTNKKGRSQLVTVAAMPKVTEDFPRQRASSVKQLPHIRELQLADPHFDIPGPIDLLLSVDVFNDILLPQKINGPKGTPTAWNTELGWGIMGKYIPDHPSELTSSSVCVVSGTTAEDSLSDMLTKFWQVEEPAKPVSPLTTEEFRIQKHYSDTHQFSPTAGRYIVSILGGIPHFN